MSEYFVRLKRDEVKRLIRAQQLKRWWVAEFTGVHKTTLRRWLSGRIDRVRHEHAAALAALLAVDSKRVFDDERRKVSGRSDGHA